MPGGALFNKVDELIRAVKKQSSASSKESSSGSMGSAIMMKLFGGKAMSAIGKGLQLIVKALNSLKGTAEETKAKMEAIVIGVDAIAKIGPSILKFAGYMALAAPLLIIGAITSPLFALSVYLITKAIQFGTKPLADEKTKLALEGLKDVAIAILALGVAMVLAVPLYGYGIKSLPYIALTLVVLGGAFFVLDKLGIADSIKKVSIGLMFASAAIVTLSLGLFFASMILDAIPDKWTTLFQVAGIVLAVGLIFFIVGKGAASIIQGAIAMTLAVIPIALLGLSIGLFSAMVPPTEEGWIMLAQVGAALLGIGALMALAGTVAPFILAGAVAMGVAGLALLFIAGGVAAFAQLFKTGGLENLLADSGHVTDSFLGFGGGRMMSKMEYFMYSLANSFLLNPLAIASMYASAPAMILVGLSLLSVAKGIEAFQRLKINYDVLPNQIEKVTTVLANTFGKIGSKFPGGRNFLSFVGLGSQSAVADGIDAVLGMGNALGSIAEGLVAMASLKFPIYQGTKIVGYKTMTSDTFTKVSVNASMITNVLADVFGEIGRKYPGGRNLFGLGSGQSDVVDGVNAVTGMGDAVAEIAKGAQLMADLKFPVYDSNGKIVSYHSLDANALQRIKTNTQSLALGFTAVFGSIGKSPDAEDSWGWFGKSNIERGISLVEDFSNPIHKLVQTATLIVSNKLDPAALKSKITGIIDAFTTAYAKVGTAKEVDAGLVSLTGLLADNLKRVSDNANGFSRFVDSYGRYVNHFVKFKDTVNQFDKENLKLTNELFQGLTYLTKTDDAIEKMGEQLVSAIDKLATMIEEAKTTITASGEKQAGVMETVGNAVTTGMNTVKGALGVTPDTPATKDPKAKDPKGATPAASTNVDGLIASMNELIARLDSSANPIRVRQV
jgi:methyl-accepting chemotaxis protein